MVVIGMLLKGHQARIVTLSGTRDSHELKSPKFNKLELPPHPTQDDVEVFVQAIHAHSVKEGVDKIVINKRSVSGIGAGGAGTFLIEGVLLAVCKAVIEPSHLKTIEATDKKLAHLKIERPGTKDLGVAYDLAFEGLA